jgi:hypothetical protein
MSDSPRVILLLVFGAISALPISPRFAYAQSTGRDSRWAVLDVTAAINSAIEESKEGVELREKVVRRFSECSLMYGGLSTLVSNAEAKKITFNPKQQPWKLNRRLPSHCNRKRDLKLKKPLEKQWQ